LGDQVLLMFLHIFGGWRSISFPTTLGWQSRVWFWLIAKWKLGLSLKKEDTFQIKKMQFIKHWVNWLSYWLYSLMIILGKLIILTFLSQFLMGNWFSLLAESKGLITGETIWQNGDRILLIWEFYIARIQAEVTFLGFSGSSLKTWKWFEVVQWKLEVPFDRGIFILYDTFTSESVLVGVPFW